jgi:cytoskeletal protein RodZ
MITRDNYEEFFLLYIDNELSVADREAVERFIAHHPDLQKDWKALLHCRLLPDPPLVFPDKELLYQAEAEEEEDLPRFSPDLSIVFPDKASLYKKGDNKRIVWLPWLRVGIAAATVGIVALLLLLSGRHTAAPSAAQPIVKNNKNVPPVTPAAAGALYSIEGHAARPAVHPATATRLTTDKPTKEKVKVKTSGKDVREEEEPVSQDLAQQAEVHDPAQVRPTDITAARAADITATKVTVTTSNVTATNITTANVHSGDAVAALQTGIPREESSFATEALHENENHDPENNILVADASPAPGKGKLRGLLRRVTRTFGKTADRDSDGQREVLVGAFQIALK